MSKLQIRERTRRGYCREAQGYAVWTEWQIVEGRRVIGRFDFETQAQSALKRMLKEREK